MQFQQLASANLPREPKFTCKSCPSRPCVSIVEWKLHEKELTKTQKRIVSPSFTLSFGNQACTFLLMIVADCAKGFQGNQGRGELKLKLQDVCSEANKNVQWRVKI